MLELCIGEGIAWVSYFPLSNTFRGIPNVTDEGDVQAIAYARRDAAPGRPDLAAAPTAGAHSSVPVMGGASSLRLSDSGLR